MLRPNTVFCCHRNEIIARLKEDFRYETRLPLTGPIGRPINDCLYRKDFSAGIRSAIVHYILLKSDRP